MSRISVITAGHLSTCPRMLKAAKSLAEAGYQVRVVSTNFEPWATAADDALRARLQLNWSVVDYSRSTANATRVRAGLRYRLCRQLVKAIGADKLPAGVVGRAMNRASPELVSATAAEPADLIYSGGGALLPATLAARRLGVPYAVDLEDFHSGEQASTTAEGRLTNALAQAAEKIVFLEAAFITTASEAIADQYATKYARRPLVINNTFPLPASAPEFSSRNDSVLRLYWFSQTIGPGRGLEDAVRAAGLADVRCELHLRGRPAPGYMAELQPLALTCAPKLTVVQHDPDSPDRMVDLCCEFDVGLALEQTEPVGRAVCLSNKAFTYILGGLAVVFTDTPGQRALAQDLGQGAWLYSPGDVARFAAGLKSWAEDRDKLTSARKAAWDAAHRRWHWKHPEEEGALLSAMRNTLIGKGSHANS